MSSPGKDALFEWFERVHGGAWGDVLDAGTGAHSLGWVTSLGARSVTAVTVEDWRLPDLRRDYPRARVLRGEWTDPALLYGEAFDQVLVDYVIGAIDGHAPYFQYGFLERLRPHCRDRLYLVGLDPQPRDGSELDEVCRVRDAAILLAGDRMYREYPMEQVTRWLGQAGFEVVDARRFPNRMGRRFVEGQLGVARRKLARMNPSIRDAFSALIGDVGERALAKGERTWGADYCIAARVIGSPGPAQ